jgi:hypothetical protein
MDVGETDADGRPTGKGLRLIPMVLLDSVAIAAGGKTAEQAARNPANTRPLYRYRKEEAIFSRQTAQAWDSDSQVANRKPGGNKVFLTYEKRWMFFLAWVQCTWEVSFTSAYNL